MRNPATRFGGMRMPPYIEATPPCSCSESPSVFGGMRMPPYIEARFPGWAGSSTRNSAACACRPTLKRGGRPGCGRCSWRFGGMRMPPYIEARPSRRPVRVVDTFGGMRMPPYIEAWSSCRRTSPSSNSAACACRPTLKRVGGTQLGPDARRFGGMRMPPYIEAVSVDA